LILPIIAYILSSTKLEIKGKIVSAWYPGGGGKGGGKGKGGGEMTQILYAHMNKRKKLN
jgi:hypothetical protein